MHFAGPPRKSSHPPPYAVRPNRAVFWRRYNSNARFVAVVLLGALSVVFILFKLFNGISATQESFSKAPKGEPNVVIVTTIDPNLSKDVAKLIKRNRELYAGQHGYATFFPNMTDYPLDGAPLSWAKVPAMRHAMTLFPKTPYYFFLDEHSLIMNYELKVEQHIMNKKRLESLMQVDVPIIPPDSVIKTFPHLKGDRIDLVLTQDKEGLLPNSFIVRRGEWAKYLLDAWFDPLYRSYNFQRAERHALEHIVQWHGTLLAKMALVHQNIMSSYTEKDDVAAAENGIYKAGDFIIYFGECERYGRNCDAEMRPHLSELRYKAHPSPNE